MEKPRKINLQSTESLEQNAEEIIFSEEDFRALLVAIENPPEPNEALESGFRWYKALIS